MTLNVSLTQQSGFRRFRGWSDAMMATCTTRDELARFLSRLVTAVTAEANTIASANAYPITVDWSELEDYTRRLGAGEFDDDEQSGLDQKLTHLLLQLAIYLDSLTQLNEAGVGHSATESTLVHASDSAKPLTDYLRTLERAHQSLAFASNVSVTEHYAAHSDLARRLTAEDKS